MPAKAAYVKRVLCMPHRCGSVQCGSREDDSGYHIMRPVWHGTCFLPMHFVVVFLVALADFFWMRELVWRGQAWGSVVWTGGDDRQVGDLGSDKRRVGCEPSYEGEGDVVVHVESCRLCEVFCWVSVEIGGGAEVRWEWCGKWKSTSTNSASLSVDRSAALSLSSVSLSPSTSSHQSHPHHHSVMLQGVLSLPNICSGKKNLLLDVILNSKDVNHKENTNEYQINTRSKYVTISLCSHMVHISTMLPEIIGKQKNNTNASHGNKSTYNEMSRAVIVIHPKTFPP